MAKGVERETEPVKIPLLLTAAELAIVLGISEPRAKKLAHRGILDCVRIEANLVRYDAATVLRFLEDKAIRGHDPCRRNYLDACLSDTPRALEDHIERARGFLERLRADREQQLAKAAQNTPKRGRSRAQGR